MRLIHVIADILFVAVTAVALWDLYMGEGRLDIRIPILGVVLFYIVLVLGPVWCRKAVHGNRQQQIRRLVELGICFGFVLADVCIEAAMGVDMGTISRHATIVAILAVYSIVAIRMTMAGRIKRRMARQTPEESE